MTSPDAIWKTDAELAHEREEQAAREREAAKAEKSKKKKDAD